MNKIIEFIESNIRPALQSHGGDIQFISFTPESGIVTVKLVGACAHCPSSALTLYDGVEKMLTQKFPEVSGIEQDL